MLAGKCSITDLPGGLTNRNYRVRTGDLDVVVRVSQSSSSLLAVDRDAEHANACAAAEVGVGAAVLDYRPDLGVLVVQYLPSATYDEASVRANLAPVGAAIRQLHAAEAFINRFDFFETHRAYLRIMQEKGLRMPDGFQDLLPTAARIEAALRARPVPLVPCHNDLLAANFLDDGERLRIIDYEYSGMNEAAFELGNCAQENGLSDDELVALVECYCGSGVTAVLTDRARLWSIMSSYGWTLWGAIQHGASDIDFDFWGWAMAKYDRARDCFASPGFEDLLDRVGKPAS